jgi:hemoglobin-like flavoprotein
MIRPEQVRLVQSTWEKIVPIADKAADLFYNRLFEIDPQLKPLFKSDIKQQGKKLMQMISTVVNSLHRLEQVTPAIQELGRRHVRYGVKNEHYTTVGGAFLWTLEQGLGPAFTAEVKEAWIAAYGILANVMKEAAARPS